MRFPSSEAGSAVRFMCVQSGDYQGLNRGKWQIAVRRSKRFQVLRWKHPGDDSGDSYRCHWTVPRRGQLCWISLYSQHRRLQAGTEDCKLKASLRKQEDENGLNQAMNTIPLAFGMSHLVASTSWNSWSSCLCLLQQILPACTTTTSSLILQCVVITGFFMHRNEKH